MAQIINTTYDKYVAEIALKCGDPLFKDFNKEVYYQAVHRSQRELARKYNILEREWTHTVSSSEAESGVVEITPLGFQAEYKVTVNDNEYSKVNKFETIINYLKDVNSDEEDDTIQTELDLSKVTYQVRFKDSKWELAYINPQEGDILVVDYTADLTKETDYDLTDENVIMLLPNSFDEEIIRMSTKYIAKVGIARFTGEKAQKYTRVYRLTGGDKPGTKPELERDRAFIKVTAFQYP